MIVLLCGNEPYLINHYKRAYAENLSFKEMNLFRTEEFTQEVYELCQQYPIIDSKRVVYLTLDELKETDLLDEYFKSPVVTTDLIITAQNIDKRTKIYKKLQSMNSVLEYNKLTEKMLSSFILSIIKKNNGSITEKGFEKLVGRINYFRDDNCNLYTVKTYVEQLLYAGNAITPELVDMVIEKTIDEQIFVLSNYLVEKDSFHLFELIDHLIQNKESPIGILSLLLRNFRLAYKISISSGDSKKAATELGVPLMQIGLFRNLPYEVVNTSMDLLQSAIKRIKYGSKGIIEIKICLGKILTLL